MIETTGLEFAARYRTVEEHAIVEMLLLLGFAFEGDQGAARLSATLALNRWLAGGLGVERGPAGERCFDPVEVVIFLKTAGSAKRDSFWSDRYIETARRLVRELPACSGRQFKVEFRRTFSLRDTPLGSALRLRAPLPLASAHGQLGGLRTFTEGASPGKLRVTDGRLEARCLAEGQQEVTLGAAFTVGGAHSGLPPAGGAGPQEHLKPVEGLIVVTPTVHALAGSLAGEHRSGLAVLRAFWDYLMDELACGPLHYDQVDSAAPGDWVLRSGWYDCQLGSALFIALCRARGIPARLVSGHFLYALAPTNHYWAEAWLDDRGWVPFDFWSWDLSGGGRDLAWREHFFGRVDHRMVMQRLPFEFTGALGMAMPNAWHMLQLPRTRGVSVSFEGLDRRPVYRDVVTVAV